MAISKLENSFNGNFDGSSQVGSVPQILLLLIMLLIDGCTSMKPSQEALSVAQLITYHAKMNKKSSKKQRHKKTARNATHDLYRIENVLPYQIKNADR